MRIQQVKIANFKRFTDLTIDAIPDDAKLVLLIGANGSGKSSIFDAFNVLLKAGRIPPSIHDDYYIKSNVHGSAPSVEVCFTNGKVASSSAPPDWQPIPKFIGRSSIRIVPEITKTQRTIDVANNSDAPERYTFQDTRFLTDVYAYIRDINKDLREPVFKGEAADTVQIFKTWIEPLNTSLLNIFGGEEATTIQLAEYDDATDSNNPPKLIFRKGQSKISYDLLSHGEKQVVILLLNFIVRQKYYEDAIIFIDEMDCHLNTALQYRLLDEIVTRWIPSSAQLWTASHALGFIDFAQTSANACVIDFDSLDFDIPQVLIPADKRSYQIFEIAVSNEFLDKIFNGKKIFFAENKNTSLYNNLSLENIVFFTGIDKQDVFHKAINLGCNGLVDRDFLLDDEVDSIKATYPNIKILPYYSFENLIYHPDNLDEYYALKGKVFDKNAYKAKIALEKKNQESNIALGIRNARDGYPFYKENTSVSQGKLTTFKSCSKNVLNMLKSDDFETFYKVFPAKDYGKQIAERQNLSQQELAQTTWFKEQIERAII